MKEEKESLNLELYRVRYKLLKLDKNLVFGKPSINHSTGKGAPKPMIGKSKLGISNA